MKISPDAATCPKHLRLRPSFVYGRLPNVREMLRHTNIQLGLSPGWNLKARKATEE